MSQSNPIRIGTRKSALALWQANWCADSLRAHDVEVELVPLVTTGDVTKGSLAVAGGEGLFTKRIQQALLDNEVDIAVHSLKDLPTSPIDGLQLAAVPARENPNDVLVCPSSQRLDLLPDGACVGTGSIRRQAQVLHHHPHLRVADIRGNVETRLAKLDGGEYDAIILAAAGLIRLKMESRITSVLNHDVMVPAVAQGALGIETRSEDERSTQVAALLNDATTHSAVLAERTLLRALRAGCLAPVGAHAAKVGEQLELTAVVLSSDGKECLRLSDRDQPSNSAALGHRLAEHLLEQGAERLIANKSS